MPDLAIHSPHSLCFGDLPIHFFLYQVLERETAKQLEVLKKADVERGATDARRKR